MSVDKKAQRIRQTPKHLEKMLFVNHKEEQGLQRRLETITTDSRVKGRLLDRERIKVRNECRFTSRLNYQNIAPLLDKLPTLIQREMTKHGYTVESVNDYLLREYRRNSRVIPTILSSIGKELDKETAESPGKDVKQSVSISGLNNDRRKSVLIKPTPSPLSNSYSNSSLIQQRRFYVTGDDNTTETDESEDINPRRITNLVKEITKIRNEMFANKKIDIMRSRVSFPELLRNVQQKDKQGSDSDTYTDGTCVLLRRKMQKIRKHTAPDPDLEVYSLLGQGHGSGSVQSTSGSKVSKKRHSVATSTFQSKVPRLPAVATKTSKSANTMSSIARQSILENDEKELKRQLEEQERQQTEMKVAIETRKYKHIQKRVDDFLQKPKKRPVIPVIYESEVD